MRDRIRRAKEIIHFLEELPIVLFALGHVHVANTHWYLTACPELMGLAVKRLETRWEGQS